jgi:hypothetical protein
MPYDMLATRRCTMDELVSIDRDMRRIENAEGLTFDGPTGIAEQGRIDAVNALSPYLAVMSPTGWDPVLAWHTGTGSTSGLRVSVAEIAVDDAVLELLKWCTVRAFNRASRTRRGKQQEDDAPLVGEAEVKRALKQLWLRGVPISKDGGTSIYSREQMQVME